MQKITIPEKLYHFFHNQRFLKLDIKGKEVYDKNLKDGGKLRIIVLKNTFDIYKTNKNGLYEEIITQEKENIDFDEIYLLMK